MECRVNFGRKSKGTLDINLSAAKKWKDYKEEISKYLHITNFYIALKCGDAILKDDDCFEDLSEVEMLLETTVIRLVVSEVDKGDKILTFFMDYDDSVGDLRRRYCEECGVKDVKLTHEEVLKDEELLRGVKCDFCGYELLTVTLVDLSGGSLMVDVFEDDTVGTLRKDVTTRGCTAEVLMFGDVELDDKVQWFMLGCRRALTVYEGFRVRVCRRGECLCRIGVHAGTEMGSLPGMVRERLRLEGRISLGLTMEGTVGESGLTKEDVVEVVGRIRVMVRRKDDRSTLTYFLEEGSLVGDFKKSLTGECGGRWMLMWNRNKLEDNLAMDSVKGGEDLELTLVEETTGPRSSFHSMFGIPFSSFDNAFSKKIIEDIYLVVVNNMHAESISHVVPIPSKGEDLYAAVSRDLMVAPCNFDIRYKRQVVPRSSFGLLGIKSGETVTMDPKRPQKVDDEVVVVVENIADKSRHNYLINRFETVAALKKVLQEQHNVNASCIRLLFGGVERGKDEVIAEIGGMVTMVIGDEVRPPREVKVTINHDVDGQVIESLSTFDNVSVESLIGRLEEESGWSMNGYVVSVNGAVLRGQNVLSTYSIADGDQMIVSRCLFVWTFVSRENSSSKVNRYPFMSKDKAVDLKERISRKLMIQTRFIHLSYNGESLEDETILVDKGIENESYLMMVSTLAGGYDKT